MNTVEIITQVADSDKEVYVCRFEGATYVVVFHEDPAHDFAVTPDGRTRTDIWDPYGPYAHPRIPERFFADLSALLTELA